MSNDEPTNADVEPFGIEDSGEQEEAWDAHDERRRKDCFAPPQETCECICMHCNRTFMSDQIWLQKVINGRDGFDGFWMCPTPNCSGAGFTFDIFPTDPAHPANAGWVSFDDSEETEEWDPEMDDLCDCGPEDPKGEWDPEEPFYKQLDEFEEEDDDIEGEEWKYGLEPGAQPPFDPHAQIPGYVDEEEAMYNQPDERPREIDATEHEARGSMGPVDPGGGKWEDDDIPF